MYIFPKAGYHIRKKGAVIMRRFWFGLSLVLVFLFTASASYIYFVLSDSRAGIDEPYKIQNVSNPQSPASVAGVASLGAGQRQVAAGSQLTLREHFDTCGHWQEQTLPASQSGLVGLSFDALAAEGWSVAQTGADSLELTREQSGLCPLDSGRRVLQQTSRSLVVYEGTAEHTGRLLMEMPLDFAQLPADMLVQLQSGGYEVASQAELDELLESLDELVRP